MKKFLLNLLFPILTFALGVGIYRVSSPAVSIQTITNYTSFYDGMNVEIETYIQLESLDEDTWYIGEPFEKMEVWTYLDLEKNSNNLDTLHSQLKENLTKQSFKRAKVRVRGTVKDNCKSEMSKGGGISLGSCCYGKSITIKTQEIIQLSPVEDYTKPVIN